MKSVARIGVAAVALLLITVSGTADAARKSKELLQYIPADTPYVMAFTKPLPDDLLDKMEPAVDETLGAYRRIHARRRQGKNDRGARRGRRRGPDE